MNGNDMNDEEKQDEAAGVEGRRPQAEGADKTAEYLAGWKRALADYDNLKKDMARERGEMRRDAMEAAAEEFLPALEHFDAAIRFTPEIDEKAKGWLQGILHIRRELEEAMKSMGVEPFGEIGEAFDPTKHESAGSRREEGKAPNVIVEVLRKGWKIGERVIRPASVIVNSNE
ncbi:nucleotide exchange factor GrpE [Patescibacteria group bacterium]|nr:MAG: nucleotide exchange factor GrpE [Patescibacteria group bacterium]